MESGLKRLVSLPFPLLCLVAALVLTPVAARSQSQGSQTKDPASEESAPELRLKPLLQQLVISHDRIRAAKAQVASARHTLEAAYGGGGSWDGWYPRVDVTVEGGKEDIHRAGAPSNKEITSKWRNQQSLTATQLLYDFGNTNSMIEYNREAMKEAEARLTQARQDILFQGVNAYLRCMSTLEIQQAAKESVRSIQQLSGMEEVLVEKGAGLSYQELQIKAQLAGSQAILVTSERDLATARNRFRSVFGFGVSRKEIKKLEAPEIPMDLIPVTVDDAVHMAMQNNPLLAEAEHSVQRLQCELAAQDSNLYPVLEFVAEAKRREKDLGEDGVRHEHKGTFQLTYNIFNGFQHVEAIKSARANLREARKTLMDRRRTVKENVRNAWVDLMTKRRNAQLYNAQSVLTEEFLALLKKKRLLGEEVQLLDILVGERDYMSATSQGVAAGIETVISSYRLVQQMGLMEVDAVQAP
jgi:adhesin transport system outer membrane protein